MVNLLEDLGNELRGSKRRSAKDFYFSHDVLFYRDFNDTGESPVSILSPIGSIGKKGKIHWLNGELKGGMETKIEVPYCPSEKGEDYDHGKENYFPRFSHGLMVILW